MRLPALGALLVCWLPGLTAAQQPALPPEGVAPTAQELKESMAQRLSAALGLPVRIDQLRYELLTSRFVGQGIEVGSRAAPLLQLGDIEVKLALLAGEGAAKVERVAARGVTLRLAEQAFEQPLRWPRRSLQLRQGEIRQATLLVGSDALRLEGVALTLEQLEVQVSGRGQLRAIHGRLALVAEKVRSGGLALGQLELRGQLQGTTLLLQQATLVGPYGTVELSGKVGVGGKVLGPWRLSGKVDLQPKPGIKLSGGVKLRGPTSGKLTTQLNLRGQGKLPARLRLEELPPIKARGNIGKRRLEGTLQDLRMR